MHWKTIIKLNGLQDLIFGHALPLLRAFSQLLVKQGAIQCHQAFRKWDNTSWKGWLSKMSCLSFLQPAGNGLHWSDMSCAGCWNISSSMVSYLSWSVWLWGPLSFPKETAKHTKGLSHILCQTINFHPNPISQDSFLWEFFPLFCFIPSFLHLQRCCRVLPRVLLQAFQSGCWAWWLHGVGTR